MTLRLFRLQQLARLTRGRSTARGIWRLVPTALREVREIGHRLPPKVVTTVHGFKFCCDTGDWIGQHIFVTGDYEDRTAAVIAALLEPGMTAVDVGANVGFFSVLMSRAVGNAGKVLAFEPLPHALERLLENLRINDVTNVTVTEQAVSAESGTARFHPGPREHTSISSMLPVSGGGPPIEVSCTTLDASLANVDVVDVMKIDVEGAEAMVIEGAAQVLSRVRYIVAEINDATWPAKLIADGYQMFHIEWDGLRPVADPAAPDLPSQYNALLTRNGLPDGLTTLPAGR